MSAAPAEFDASAVRAGSPEHKQLLARFFFQTHLEYDPERIARVLYRILPKSL